jgi:hypothetical protein
MYVKFCSSCMCTGGTVVESWAADLKDVSSPPDYVLKFIKSWRFKREITHFRKLYVISA